MGLTKASTGTNILEEAFLPKNGNGYTVALAGNPNVGKSTIFNSLTGMHQHTGNWPGKTVANATGEAEIDGENFLFVDIPGTYSIMSHSEEEEIARDYICFGNPDATVVVVDATCLERNLNLVFQIMEITNNVIVCVNLLDEAKKKRIRINLNKLQSLLGVPVVGTIACKKRTLEHLKQIISKVCKGEIIPEPKLVKYSPQIEECVKELQDKLEENAETECIDVENGNYEENEDGVCEIRSIAEDTMDTFQANVFEHDTEKFFRWISLKMIDGEPHILQSIESHLGINLQSEKLSKKVTQIRETLQKDDINMENFKDKIVADIMKRSEDICKEVCTFENEDYGERDRKIDRILTSKKWGIPIMILFLGIIFWITMVGANYPSQLLFSVFGWIQEKLVVFAEFVHSPQWLTSLLIDGMYQTLTWVVAVMLPPMAIFFPLFTFLEDLGYLPRIAFNMDGFFKKACCSGKQMITMCMGFGCNAAGVVGCRIIDSPRERLIAILTNNFVPCNRKISVFNYYSYNFCIRYSIYT